MGRPTQVRGSSGTSWIVIRGSANGTFSPRHGYGTIPNDDERDRYCDKRSRIARSVLR